MSSGLMSVWLMSGGLMSGWLMSDGLMSGWLMSDWLMSGGLMSGWLMSDGLMSGWLMSGWLMSGWLMSGGLMSGALMSGWLMSGGLMSGWLMSGGPMSGGPLSGWIMSGGLMSGGLMSGGLMSGGPLSGWLLSAVAHASRLPVHFPVPHSPGSKYSACMSHSSGMSRIFILRSSGSRDKDATPDHDMDRLQRRLAAASGTSDGGRVHAESRDGGGALVYVPRVDDSKPLTTITQSEPLSAGTQPLISLSASQRFNPLPPTPTLIGGLESFDRTFFGR